MNKQILELIKLVDSKFDHIQQLITLIEILDEAADDQGYSLYSDEVIVAKTTHNSHYDYDLYLDMKYQWKENHIDNIMKDGSKAKIYK